MPVFKYRAIDQDKKTINGLVEAPNNELAADILKDRNLTIIALEQTEEKKELNIPLLGRIKPKDVVIFSRQFSVLISANVALVQALRILSDQTTNHKFKVIIAEMADQVDAGSRLSEVLGKHPELFSDFYVNVIKSGETSGKLDEVLNYLADELEKDYDMTSKIKGAMIYPAFVLCLLGGVGVLMMVFVVPKLTAIIAESGGELPLPTKMLMATSNFLVKFWWLIILLIIGIIVFIHYFKKTPAGRKTLDILLFKTPIFGRLFKMITLVRFCRSLQTLLVGGVNMSRSLEIAADVVENEIYHDMILETKKEVENGNSISTVFLKSPDVPRMVPQMLLIGEKTGRLDIILGRITDFYSREINNIVANLLTLMEPLIMVIMGVGVGLMVAAIILPMYNMTSTMGN